MPSVRQGPGWPAPPAGEDWREGEAVIQRATPPVCRPALQIPDRETAGARLVDAREAFRERADPEVVRGAEAHGRELDRRQETLQRILTELAE